MVKFESPTIGQRKLEDEFGKNAPKKDWIIAIFQRFCEIGTVENRERSKITEKIDKVHHVTENQQQTSVRDCCNGLLYFSNNSTSTYDCIETLQSSICSKIQ